MLRKEILRRFENLLVNSNIDVNSKVWKEAIEALIAININQIEEE
jgi:hypothetical protein